MAKTNTVQAELTLLDKLTAPLKAAAAQVSASTKQMNTAFTGVSNAFSKVNQAMIAITAVLAGGAAFKSAIDQTVNYRLEVEQLSRVLGVTLLQATGFKEALEDLGLSTDVLSNASRALGTKVIASGKSIQEFTNQLTGNKDIINNNGDAIMSIIARVQQLSDKSKQGAFLQEAFGRAYQGTLPLLRMTREELARVTESAKGNEEVTKKQIEQIYAYKKAQEGASDTLRDFNFGLADEIIPVLIKFSDSLARNAEGARLFGQTIGIIAKIIFSPLIIAFEAIVIVIQAVVFLWNLVIDTGKYLTSILYAIGLALSGDFTNSWKVAGAATDKWLKDTLATLNRAGKAVDTFNLNVAVALGLYTPPAKAAKPEEKTKPSGAIPVTDEASKKNLEAQTQDIEKESNRIKTLYAGRTTWMRAELEKQYQSELQNLSNLKLTEEDKAKLAAKLNKELSTLRQERIQEQLQLDQMAAKQELTTAQQNNAFILAQAKSSFDKQQISSEQLIAKKKELHDADIAAEQTYLAKMFELSKGNAVSLQQLEDEKAAKALESRLTKEALEQEALQKEKGRLEELQSMLVSSFQQSLDGILTGTMSFSEAMANIWLGLGQMLNKVIWQMVKEWIEAETGKLIAAKLTATSSAAANVTSAGVSTAASSAAAGVSISNDAAKGTAAAIAAWASQNPIAAIAVGAVIGAAIYALLGNVKSAKGGYANVEMDGQMAQLHKGEMVLPAQLAEGIRNIAMGNQTSGNSGSVTYNINAMDASSFDSYLKANAGSVFAANKLALRNGSQFA